MSTHKTATISDFITQEFDYLIIGGGTAGLAVAARLSEDLSLTIGVLEAGPGASNHDADNQINIPGLYGRSLGTELDWQFETTPQPGLAGRKLPWPRGKVLGGTSALNFMTWNRASREDYDSWVELGNAGPFFKRSEGFQIPDAATQHQNSEFYDMDSLGLDGPVKISYSKEYSASHKLWHATLNTLGIETNPAHLSGSNVGVWTNISSVDAESCARSYSSSAYYQPNASRPNLFVLAEALVREIDIRHVDGEWVAQGVRFSHRGEEHYVAALREVILSAGSVQSPQLLELSGVGGRDVLSRAGVEVKVDNLNVGENLQDHMMTAMIFEVDASLANPDDLKSDDGAWTAAWKEYMQSRTGPLAVLPCSICYLPLSHFMPDENRHSIASEVDNLTDITAETRKILKRRFEDGTRLGQIEYIFDLGNWNPNFNPNTADGKKYGTMLQILQYPFSRGSIHIPPSAPSVTGQVSRPASIADKPVINPQYYTGENGKIDLDIMIHCAQFANTICQTYPLASIIRSRASPPPTVLSQGQWRDWIVDNTITDWHPVGTCAMGGRGRGMGFGVVDERLRVYGVGRLRVVDASIMPLQIGAHLQATVYAIAEKASYMILEDMLERRVTLGSGVLRS